MPLAWGSAWIAYQAVRVLGRHWSLEARLLPGHRLVREGPYAWVRHPIYAAMLGLFVGTGLSLTPLPVLLVAVGVYPGHLRKERLLRRQFGDEYCATSRGAALVPGPIIQRLNVRTSCLDCSAEAHCNSLIEMLRN